MTYQKTVRQLLDRLEPEQYIAIGSGSGSGFYFIGQVKRYRKDIDGINEFQKENSGNPDEYVPLEDRIITDIRNRHIPGEPPMLAVLAEGTEAGHYWILGEYDKSFKAPPTRIKDLSGLQNLLMAITMRAVNDYEEAITNPGAAAKLGVTTESLGRFFRGDWGSLITGADGGKIEEVCRLRANYKIWRRKQGCPKCKREKCIHYSGEHFTTMERGKLTCLKEANGDEADG